MTPAEISALMQRAYTHGEHSWSEADIAETLAKPSAILTTSAHAMALGQLVLDEAELLALAVQTGVQCRGHGRAILADFEAACNARGASVIFLEVSETNLPARRLYELTGFEAAGRRRGYYRSARGPSADAILYRKQL